MGEEIIMTTRWERNSASFDSPLFNSDDKIIYISAFALESIHEEI